MSPAWRQWQSFVDPRRVLSPRKSGWVQVGKNSGQFIEDNARMTLFASRLAKGDDVRTAAKTVKKFLGDYRPESFTQFENDVIFRAVPFGRWMRFNVPLQFEQMLLSNKKRARTLALLRGQELGQEAIKELTGGAEVDAKVEDLPAEIPDWIREAAGVPVRRDPNTGELQFFIMENFFPVADLDNFIPGSPRETARFGLRSLSPLLTKIPEFALGESFFLDRKIEGDPPGEFLGQRMDPEFINHIRTLRFLSELDRLDPLGTFHQIRPQLPAGERALRFLGLFPTQRVNQARAKISYDAERLERYRKHLNAYRRWAAVDREEKKEEETDESN